MTIVEYQKSASRTRSNLDSNLEDNIHMSLGLVTEAGELADVFKKKLAYNKEIDWTNVREEIGDLLWYAANMCNINGWNMEDILETNINKLKVRYPEKFDESKAINRDLDSERKELER